MKTSTRTSLGSVLMSLALHGAVLLLLVVSFNITPEIASPAHQDVSIVQTVAVNEKQVEEEVERIREQERKKEEQQKKQQEELQEKMAAMQKKAEAAERERKAEEQRLVELRRKKEEEQKAREAEQKRLAELKQQQEELEKKRQAEEEKRRQEAEARRKAEEEKKRKDAEEALKKQLAEEQRQREAAQASQDQAVLNEYLARVKSAIQREFNTAGLPPGLSCVLRIRMAPGGDVVAVQTVSSSGNDIFDRRAETAVTKASPLPVPDELRLFEQMREIRLTFEPRQ